MVSQTDDGYSQIPLNGNFWLVNGGGNVIIRAVKSVILGLRLPKNIVGG